jgi:chemotaxis protein MotB
MKKDRQEPIIIIRKKGRHGSHHGGAWKVAFADFMTAMFALFLVLWLINQSSDIKAAIAGYFQDPLGRADEHGSSIIPGQGAQAQTVQRPLTQADVMAFRKDRLQHLAGKLEKELASAGDGLESVRDHVEITMTEDGLLIELIEDSKGFFFEKGSSAPSTAGRKILALLGSELGALNLPVRIEGHTDAFAYKSTNGYSNWELSADRANAARRIMNESGLNKDQITSVLALADRQPKMADDPFSARNRRVTITMLLTGEGFEEEDGLWDDSPEGPAEEGREAAKPDSVSPAPSHPQPR